MAANIFNPADYANLQKRLQLLQADSNRLWGKMTVAEMLRHVRSQIDSILDPDPNTRIYKTMFRFAPLKWIALYIMPVPKNMKTAPQMDVTKKLKDTTDFDNEKAKIEAALAQLMVKEIIRAINPLFGMLGKKDWGRVLWLHLDHHLRQFGV